MYTFWAWRVVGESRADSRNSKWLSSFLSAREIERTYARFLSQSEVLVRLSLQQTL